MTPEQAYLVLRYAKKRSGIAPAGRGATVRAHWHRGDWVFDFSDPRKGVGRRDWEGANEWLRDVSFYPYLNSSQSAGVRVFFIRLWITIRPRWLRPVILR